MKSTQFEREVIVAHNLQNVYFDFDFDRAVDIFMKREKNKDWNDEETRDALYYMEAEKELFVNRGEECDGEECDCDEGQTI